MLIYYLLILIAAIIHSYGEVLYKKGTTTIFRNDTQSKFDLLKGFLSKIIIISLIFSIIAKVVYGISLTHIPISIGNPIFLSLVVIISTIFGVYFYNEKLSLSQVIGLFLTSIGIYLVI